MESAPQGKVSAAVSGPVTSEHWALVPGMFWASAAFLFCKVVFEREGLLSPFLDLICQGPAQAGGRWVAGAGSQFLAGGDSRNQRLT